MIAKEDIDAMNDMGYEYYDPPTSNPFNYSKWVEGKIITEGNTRLVENTLGLLGEAGEVAEKVKKLMRDSTRFSNEDILKELGDVLFYATALANLYGGSLQKLIEMNVAKLDDRQARGVLQGSGDNR